MSTLYIIDFRPYWRNISCGSAIKVNAMSILWWHSHTVNQCLSLAQLKTGVELTHHYWTVSIVSKGAWSGYKIKMHHSSLAFPFHSEPSAVTLRWRQRIYHCITTVTINPVVHTFWIITHNPAQTHSNYNEQQHVHSVEWRPTDCFYFIYNIRSALNPNTCLYFVSTDAEDLVSGKKAEKIILASNNLKRDSIQIQYARYLLRCGSYLQTVWKISSALANPLSAKLPAFFKLVWTLRKQLQW